jgi:hypothetical protein
MKKYIVILFAAFTASSFAQTLNAYKGSERSQTLEYNSSTIKPIIAYSQNNEIYLFTNSTNNISPTTATKVVTRKRKNAAGVTIKQFFVQTLLPSDIKVGFYNNNRSVVLGNINLGNFGTIPCSGNAKNGFMNTMKSIPYSRIENYSTYVNQDSASGSFRQNNSLLNGASTISAAIDALRIKLLAQGYTELA